MTQSKQLLLVIKHSKLSDGSAFKTKKSTILTKISTFLPIPIVFRIILPMKIIKENTMKKKTLMKFFLAGSAILALAGCGKVDNGTSSETPSSTTEVTIPDGNFNVDESKTETVDLGSSYYIDPITVKDSANQYHKAVITVKDANGKEYEVKDSSFTPDHIGIYTITYTINYGNNQSISKSYTITVADLSAPEIVSDFKADNLIILGETVDLSSVTVSDNSKEDITPTVKVTYNNEEVAVTDNKFVADKKGIYKVNVAAEDSSGNKLDKSFNIFTVVDGEVSPTNQWHPMSVSDAQSYNGTKSIEADWFSEHPAWCNDFSLLGSDFALLGEATYLSFWIYFDAKAVNADNIASVYKYTYYQTYCYDEFGNEVPAYSQGPNAFELKNNAWYRLVLDISVATNSAADGRECHDNPKSMSEVAFGFGAWDSNISGNATKAQKVYLDDIRLSNELDDEEYHEDVPPAPVESDYMADETNATTLSRVAMYDGQKAANGEWVTSNALIDYTLAHGTKDSYTPLVTNSVGTLGPTSTSPNGESKEIEVANWRMYFKKDDGVVYAAKAKQHCFIKTEDDSSTLGGYVQAKFEWVVLNADGSVKSEYNKTFNSAAEANGNLGSAYTELQKDETFLFVVTSSVDDTRNMQFQPSLVVAPAKLKNSGTDTPTFEPNTENEVVYDNQFGLFGAQKTNSGNWITTNENADYTVAHGTADSFSPMVTDTMGFLGVSAEGGNGEEGNTQYQTWRMFFNRNDGIVYAAKAKKHCFVKVQEQTNIGGWVQANLDIKVFDKDNNAISSKQLSFGGTEEAKGKLGCDYMELQAGQTFVWAMTSSVDATRNLQYCPSLVIAPVK